ncbi:MAG: hypothetical protein LBF91_02845 [Azoarcus sp.]|jgi:hypothetical protein|nr:hypothetical protein [Azoarcus sp.]
MRLPAHDAHDYADAMRALLPPGRAWEWPPGGLGSALLASTAQELARIDTALPGVLDNAIETHRPRFASWPISEYRRAAEAALAAAGAAETFPRLPLAAGSHVGDRCWSAEAPQTDFAVPLVQIFHLFAPMAVGRHGGDGSGRDPAARCWSAAQRTRAIMLVRYYKTVTPLSVLRAALEDFKQAHVLLWFEDITGAGG